MAVRRANINRLPQAPSDITSLPRESVEIVGAGGAAGRWPSDVSVENPLRSRTATAKTAVGSPMQGSGLRKSPHGSGCQKPAEDL